MQMNISRNRRRKTGDPVRMTGSSGRKTTHLKESANSLARRTGMLSKKRRHWPAAPAPHSETVCALQNPRSAAPDPTAPSGASSDGFQTRSIRFSSSPGSGPSETNADWIQNKPPPAANSSPGRSPPEIQGNGHPDRTRPIQNCGNFLTQSISASIPTRQKEKGMDPFRFSIPFFNNI